MANSLFNKILASLITKKRVLGIDIGSSSIKIVELERSGEHAILQNYGEIALGPYAGLAVGQATNLSTEKISAALNDLLKEAKIGVRNAVVAIPIGSSLLSFIEVPSTDPKQLEKLIPLEARKYIPVPISEVTIDWWVLPRRGEATKTKTLAKPEETKNVLARETKKEASEVVISAIHNETLNKYESIQKATGITVDQLEIEIFSSIRSVIGRDMSPLMILDIGASTTKLALVEHGIVKSYHIINKGSQDITTAIAGGMEVSMDEAEKIKRKYGLHGSTDTKQTTDVASAPLGYIFAEASNAASSFERTYGVTFKKIILTGGGSLLKGLPDLAGRYFHYEVALGKPFERVEHPAFLEGVLAQVGPEFAVAVGLAFKGLEGGE